MKNVRKNIGTGTFFPMVLTGPQCGCIPFVGYKSKEVITNVHPCCGPGSVGWPPENVLPSEREPYGALSLFGNDKGNKPADGAPVDESGHEKS